MKQIKIQYLGKKKGVSFMCLTTKIKLTGNAFWVSEENYKWLSEVNPKMFVKLDEKELDEIITKPEPEPDEDEEPEPDPEIYSDGEFKCEKCGADFKVKWTYERHIKRCTGPESE